MAPTPSSAKHRLNYRPSKPSPAHPSPSPVKDLSFGHCPVEVIARVRELRDDAKDHKPGTVLQVTPGRNAVRVRADFGYRDFTLDGVSVSEDEDLEVFYHKFVEDRIKGVKLGDKCTIMMYGPTGSGKSYTMFGCSKQAGIVYRSLRDILGERDSDLNEDEDVLLSRTFVQVTVLEVYNEEIYDLLSTTSAAGGVGFGWPKGSSSKMRLEVIGKKAKNATFISGNNAGWISKEIQKVEKRRIVKSTLCNDRSSRSHCMIILDVPTVGGRVMLVDMAGSENIEQAGQVGLEAKMQTAKINQGNTALKRVVESIANGDSHVPFRDSKLTMLLQDSFEDDKSKILMILCASPDQKELHKTISTLEYGAKAKCIDRSQHTPMKEKLGVDDSSAADILMTRIAAMDQFIHKLQVENKIREKERTEAHKEVLIKEQEVADLREKLQIVEGKGSGACEEEINMKVSERIEILRNELEKQLEECQRITNDFVENEKRKMEERMWQQQREVEKLKRRLQEIETQFSTRSGTGDFGDNFACRLMGSISTTDNPGNMVKSMDLDVGDQESFTHEISSASVGVAGNEILGSKLSDSVRLSIVVEEEEAGECKESFENEEVEKEIIEEKRVCSSTFASNCSPGMTYVEWCCDENLRDRLEHVNAGDVASSRHMRIQNIFTLCGNDRELSQHLITPPTKMQRVGAKENHHPCEERSDSRLEVYVKWEASNENAGKFITTLNVVKEATLADLRKLIEIFLAGDSQEFAFLVLGDPNGASVPKEKETMFLVRKLPVCNKARHGHLACIRPAKCIKWTGHVPLSPIENKLLPLTPIPCSSAILTKSEQNLNMAAALTPRSNLAASR